MSFKRGRLIKSTDYTPGNVHGFSCFTELPEGYESSASADSGYIMRKACEVDKEAQGWQSHYKCERTEAEQ